MMRMMMMMMMMKMTTTTTIMMVLVLVVAVVVDRCMVGPLGPMLPTGAFHSHPWSQDVSWIAVVRVANSKRL